MILIGLFILMLIRFSQIFYLVLEEKFKI